MRPDDEQYFDRLESELDAAIDVANTARQRGGDPEPSVEIPVAQDMADRVENILGIDGVADRVRALEADHSREEAALALVEDFVDGTVGDFDTKAGTIEGAVRTAVALLTEGVVAAPIEGIDRVEVLENEGGREFVNVYYAGPIRSAGGTAQALSVLAADYARALLGIENYDARPTEVGRYAEEVALYDKTTGLQYAPSEAETEFIAENLPIMLDGEATGDEEVSGHRDLDRVDTNSARGGMCLVLAEGIALKAPKIQRYTRDLEAVDWPWLQDLIDGSYDDSAETDTDGDRTETGTEDEASSPDQASGPPRVEPSNKYLRDLIAGRPVFSHPSRPGGFRLRYGRARNHGFATAGVHPATMHLVGDFLATGTQIKTERPGKAAGVVPVDSIEGPTVRLADGSVRYIDDAETAREVQNGVEAILDLGEYLVNFGEFVENNHPLAPASYTVEWWIQEFAAAGGPVQAFQDAPDIDLESPSPDEVLEWAEAYDAPLHPAYTYLWHDLTVDAAAALADAIDEASLVSTDGATLAQTPAGDRDQPVLAIEHTPESRAALETLLIEHTQTSEDLLVPDWRPLVRTLGFDNDLQRSWSPQDVSTTARTYDDGENAIKFVDEVAPFHVRERAPTRIGNRMGRPEKSEERELSPAVHTLFPIGEAGGDQRSVEDAAQHGDSVDGTKGSVEVEVGRRACVDCEATTFHPRCQSCGGTTRPVYLCPDCDREIEADGSGQPECSRCDTRAWKTQRRTIAVGDVYEDALRTLGERAPAFDILKGVKGLSSASKAPEPMEKGILRAKHDVSAFKDGTIRYDMTDLPVTSVRPSELDVTAEHFRELGYETDRRGDPLEHDDQLVELKVQDIVLSDGGAEHLVQTAAFVDDLLEQYYGLDSYYDLDGRDDLVGELVFGMAPHTSAAVVGRVVGFTSAAVGYAHPYFHASKRRNCFHPATKIWYEDETGQWHYDRLDSIVEGRLDDPSQDAAGTLIQDIGGDISVASLNDEEAVCTQPVSSVSKHVAPDHMIRIETQTGRELTVTPDHTMQVFDTGGVREKRATTISSDDRLVTPAQLSIKPSQTTIDALETVAGHPSIESERLVLRGLTKETGRALVADLLPDDGLTQADPIAMFATLYDVAGETLHAGFEQGELPVSLLCQAVETPEALARAVPDDVSIGVTGEAATIDSCVQIDERVGKLLGSIAANAPESDSPVGADSGIWVSPRTPAERSFLCETVPDLFNVDVETTGERLRLPGRAIEAFFGAIPGSGGSVRSDRIPDCIFGAPNSVVAGFLAGYFGCPRDDPSPDPAVGARVDHRETKEALLGLCTRVGVSPTVRESREDRPYLFELSAQAVETLVAEDAQSHRERGESVACDGGRGYHIDPIETVEYVTTEVESTYCLTVPETHTVVANDTVQGQCDGDEDCVMLLLDGLLNFSKTYLPDQRGGRMDCPLVMSSRIDPTEIDDEAHNVDIVDQYPLEFYEASRELASPDEVSDLIRTAESTLGTDDQYRGFDHTHDTGDIAAGPDLSAYKTLGSMQEKMDEQLSLARRLRAVEESDVAERVIEYHFLPDLIGNLRAFSRQEVRCLDCGIKYRRMPLTGSCRECGGNVNLTVHQGSVTKYMETAMRIAEEFGAREYTKQRLEILQRRIDRLFEDDTNKQSGIADFM